MQASREGGRPCDSSGTQSLGVPSSIKHASLGRNSEWHSSSPTWTLLDVGVPQTRPDSTDSVARGGTRGCGRAGLRHVFGTDTSNRPDRAVRSRTARRRPCDQNFLVTGPSALLWRVEDSNLCSFRDGFTVRSHWPLGQPAPHRRNGAGRTIHNPVGSPQIGVPQ